MDTYTFRHFSRTRSHMSDPLLFHRYILPERTSHNPTCSISSKASLRHLSETMCGSHVPSCPIPDRPRLHPSGTSFHRYRRHSMHGWLSRCSRCHKEDSSGSSNKKMLPHIPGIPHVSLQKRHISYSRCPQFDHSDIPHNHMQSLIRDNHDMQARPLPRSSRSYLSAGQSSQSRHQSLPASPGFHFVLQNM